MVTASSTAAKNSSFPSFLLVFFFTYSAILRDLIVLFFFHDIYRLEILPLVEFFVADGINEEEALQLITTEPSMEIQAVEDKSSTLYGTNYQIYKHSQEQDLSKDPFTAYLYGQPSLQDKNPTKIILDRETLTRLKPTEVIVCSWPAPIPSRYFRNFLPDVALKRCKHCNKIFHADDYELHFLQKNHCPYCRTQTVVNSTTN